MDELESLRKENDQLHKERQELKTLVKDLKRIVCEVHDIYYPEMRNYAELVNSEWRSLATNHRDFLTIMSRIPSSICKRIKGSIFTTKKYDWQGSAVSLKYFCDQVEFIFPSKRVKVFNSFFLVQGKPVDLNDHKWQTQNRTTKKYSLHISPDDMSLINKAIKRIKNKYP